MLFNSIEFAFFFPIVTLLFFLLPHRFRWFLPLTASINQQQFINYTQYYKDMAFKKEVPITGSFDCAAYGINQSAFYDDSHSTKESLKKIITQQ